MISPFAVVALGFVLGMRHATDADHVLAVMTIVSRQRSLKPAAWIGALWGIGHTLTIVLVGSAIILFNVVIPERVSLAMEGAVAVMLIVLGLTNLAGSAPAGDGAVTLATPRLFRPMAVGIVHGLAGSAAVALLVLATIRDAGWAVAYLLVFGLGTVAGMVLLTTVAAAPLVYWSHRLQFEPRFARLTTGGLSMAFGLLLAYRIGSAPGW